ncbi:hypothetical protein CC77DRAFT_1011548 [Alternaria alternata]|uniref:Uncharacterized protein n=1 Tax=Alternaria alternata TaxID=5599 RepID=A0A177DE19_ALTAL|nr:hypothetical protein CC77DRAFT_1011548 [Alternaria alternata]KAH6862595.1 hypothetical protein B0T12DRAFT_392237 [Alternaria alternata]OAG17059.1 hypothetical protein CC77DRAFT_1011548 [Alternaria alternata]
MSEHSNTTGTSTLPVSGVDGYIQDAVGRNSDAGVLECEHDFSFVPAWVHMSWKTMFFGSTNGTARRNGEDMVTILIVVDFRSAHSLLSLRTWNVGERLRPTDMMSLFACFDAPPHTIFCRYASFGKQGRTGDNDIEERRRSSLPPQNLYVNQAGFSRHRSYSAHDEIAGMFFQSVRETTYVVVGQSLVMAFC